MATDWQDNLKAFDMDAVKPIFEGDSAVAVNARIGLNENRKLSRRSDKRTFLHALHISNAAEHLARLPEVGESVHCVMSGNYNAWDLVPAVLRLAVPATIEALHVATLGYNRANAEELIALFDGKHIGRVSFLCAHYFKSTTPDLFEFLHGALSKREQRCAAVRSHAKILGFQMSDGRAFTIESSANLRSCNNVESFTLTHDAALLSFHQSWIDELLTEAGA